MPLGFWGRNQIYICSPFRLSRQRWLEQQDKSLLCLNLLNVINYKSSFTEYGGLTKRLI